MKSILILCIFPCFSWTQSTFYNYFPTTVAFNKEIRIEKVAGRSTSLFIQEEYVTLPPEAYTHFHLSTIFGKQPDSLSILGGFEEKESNYGWLLVASWKNGRSQEVAVSYSIRTGQLQTQLWLVDPFETNTLEENAVIYAESGGNFYIEFSASTNGSELIKKYYSFNEDTGLFDLSE